MLDFTEADVAALRHPTKSSFNLDHIAATAMNLKDIRQIELQLAAERQEPPEELARYLPGRMYVGPRTVA